MKTNMTAMTITARISFGCFENGAWMHSSEPVIYKAATKAGNETLKFDCHLSMDDGTIITVPAFGQTAMYISRMMMKNADGTLRPIRSGDLVTVDIPSTTYKRSAAYRDNYLGQDLMADYHNAPYFSLARSANSVVAKSEEGVRI